MLCVGGIINCLQNLEENAIASSGDHNSPVDHRGSHNGGLFVHIKMEKGASEEILANAPT